MTLWDALKAEWEAARSVFGVLMAFDTLSGATSYCRTFCNPVGSGPCGGGSACQEARNGGR